MKKVYIERNNFLFRAAVYREDKLQDMYFEKSEDKPKEGSIYVGEVKNILASLKGAFVDIGYEKNVFLYLNGNTEIKKGDMLAVQIIKEEEGDKSAKSSLNLLLPGRYVMLQTLNEKIDFSKKLEEEYKEIIKKEVKLYPKTGIIIRSNSIETPIEGIKKEYDNLYKIYLEIKRKEEYSNSVGLIYDFNGILGKLFRDISNDVEYIAVNNIKDKCFIEEYIRDKIKSEVILENNAFLKFGIEDDIKALLRRKVILPSKGNIIIDKTEAMYVIDVNSSKNVSENTIAKTAFKTNMEAAMEIPRQIRLRGLSGIIVIDFIDMKDKDKKEELLQILQQGFKDDRLKPSLFPFTELNLIQITRKKVTPLSYYFLEDCSCCSSGKLLNPLYLSILINERIDMENMENPLVEIRNIYEKSQDSLLFYLKHLIGENIKISFKEQEQDFIVNH